MRIFPVWKSRPDTAAAAVKVGFSAAQKGIRKGCIDMHLHASTGIKDDGKFTSPEIVSSARFLGLSCIALTPHFRLGNLDGLATAKIIGQKVIPGVELATESSGFVFHILGYFNIRGYTREFEDAINRDIALIDRVDPGVFKDFSDRVKKETSVEIVPENISESSGGSFSKCPDILFKKHLPLMFELFRSGFSFLPETRHAIDLVHKYGGKAVLAHPRWISPRFLSYRAILQKELDDFISDRGLSSLTAGFTFSRLEEWIKNNFPEEFNILMDSVTTKWLEQQYSVICGNLLHLGLDGIETHTSYTELQDYPAFKRSYMQKDHELAAEYGLNQTAGTDFHGGERDGLMMGTGINNTFSLPAELIDWLLRS